MKYLVSIVCFVMFLGDTVLFFQQGSPYGQLAGLWALMGALVFGFLHIVDWFNDDVWRF